MTSSEIGIMRDNYMTNMTRVLIVISIFFIMALLVSFYFCDPVIGKAIVLIISILVYTKIALVMFCVIRICLYLTDILKEAEKKGK